MENKKYQKSINGHDCIGPCYKPGVPFLHPVTFKRHNSWKDPMCPINETIKKTGEIRYTDMCLVHDDVKNSIQEELIPNIGINLKRFLAIYYNIFSLDDGIKYITENKHLNIYTKKRIINSIINSFDIDLIDPVIINFFKDYFIKHIDDFLNRIDSEKIKNEKEKFISEKLITDININKFLGKILEKYKKKDELLNDYYLVDKLKNDFTIYLNKKVNNQ